MRATHEVVNQPPPLVDYNVFARDRALVEAVARGEAAWACSELEALGSDAGTADWQKQGALANQHPPVLQTHDRFGHRIDEIEFHPAWHRLLDRAVEHGLHARAWSDARPGAHVARAAAFVIWSQVEAGHLCPVSMTFAAIPVLRHAPALASVWEPRLASGALCGMAMTEKQGGSDVRANSTRAESLGVGAYLLTGHKWFCSAPMSDAFLVLAQTDQGLGCFFMPRLLDDGTRNKFFIQRLKDKLGNRSNASSEVELDGAWAQLIGAEGRGVPVIAEMVNSTRLDCILGTAALMRQALAQAVHHATHRNAFGRRLVDQPLMRTVLADLALESEAATTLALRLASAMDHAAHDEHEALVKRLGTALGKYWVCKRGATFVAEALECLGGNGYVEDSGLPRLYREAPLNSIWEGAGNIQALDMLRVIAREPRALEAVLGEIGSALGGNRHLDAAVRHLHAALTAPDEHRARWLAERLALALQASLLVRHAPTAVADAFCAARLGGEAGLAFGTLPIGLDLDGILDRAWPSD